MVLLWWGVGVVLLPLRTALLGCAGVCDNSGCEVRGGVARVGVVIVVVGVVATARNPAVARVRIVLLWWVVIVVGCVLLGWALVLWWV